jgi:hypothetical protein
MSGQSGKFAVRNFRFLFKTVLTVAFVCCLRETDSFAQTVRHSVSPRRDAVSLTRTTFHGSNHHSDSADDHDLTDDFLRIEGKRELSTWKYKIATTIFWVGEQPTDGNPVSNVESAWDRDWVTHYGGEDAPTDRIKFRPGGFAPKQNPFYVALPYNDVEDEHTRSEAVKVIPWFNNTFVREGQSVCKDHWVAIRHGKRTCYAQWEDVGPFQVDHWEYVFGSERPRPNRNHNAGLDVSPAVRDYLGLSGIDICDWKFVNAYEVPNGPWTLYRGNQSAAKFRHRTIPAVVEK